MRFVESVSKLEEGVLVSDIRPPPVTYLHRVLTGDRLEDGKAFRVTGKLDVHSHTFTMTVDGCGIGTRVETDRMPDMMLGTGMQLPDDLLRTGDVYPPAAAAGEACHGRDGAGRVAALAAAGARRERRARDVRAAVAARKEA